MIHVSRVSCESNHSREDTNSLIFDLNRMNRSVLVPKIIVPDTSTTFYSDVTSTYVPTYDSGIYSSTKNFRVYQNIGQHS